MISHVVAFAFHRTAYSDRVTTLKEALSAIEHLRNYRPKYRESRSSGWGFAALGGSTPLSEKEGHNFFTPRSGHSRKTHSVDALSEDADRTLVASKGKKRASRSSWFGVRKATEPVNPITDSPHPDEEFGKLQISVHAPDSPVSATPLNHEDSRGSTPHRYPPSGGRSTPVRHLEPEGAGETLYHAAKALGQAVLHDARNLKGKSDEDSNNGMLGTNALASASEAKVQSQCKRMFSHSHRFLD
jgi:hypothetical protein